MLGQKGFLSIRLTLSTNEFFFFFSGVGVAFGLGDGLTDGEATGDGDTPGEGTGDGRELAFPANGTALLPDLVTR